MKNVVLSVTLLLSSLSGFAQESDPAQVQQWIDAKRFVFVAEYASPLKGGRRYLNSRYTFRVSPDTLDCDLPYYGRAYQAPMNTDDVGIKFISTSFEYTPEPKKKNKGWDISIKTKDQRNTIQARITVFKNGRASLYINATDRQSISYDGYIQEKK